MSDTDSLRRLEDKVDKLTEAVVHLARIDERQISASRDMGALTVRMEKVERQSDATDSTLNRWINRGIGAWVVGSVLVSAAFTYIAKFVAP